MSKFETVVKVTDEDIKRYTECKCCGKPANLSIVLGNKVDKKEAVQSSRLCNDCASELFGELENYLGLNYKDELLMQSIKNIDLEEETRG